jgi:hypothetical protein
MFVPVPAAPPRSGSRRAAGGRWTGVLRSTPSGASPPNPPGRPHPSAAGQLGRVALVAALEAIGVTAAVNAAVSETTPVSDEWSRLSLALPVTGIVLVVTILALGTGAVLSGVALTVLRVRQSATIAALGTGTVAFLLLGTRSFFGLGRLGLAGPAVMFVPEFVVVFVGLAAVLALPPWPWWGRWAAAGTMAAAACGTAWMLNLG